MHLSSGWLLRDEVQSQTPLGKECAEIMKRGELVSSEVMTALLRRRMRLFPKRRVLLDGFPRSLQNVHDFIRHHCGNPEVALWYGFDEADIVQGEMMIILKRQWNKTIRKSNQVKLYTMNKFFHAKIVFSQKIMFVLHDYRRFNLFSITYFSFSSFFPNAWTSMLFFLKIRNGLLLWKLFYYSK